MKRADHAGFSTILRQWVKGGVNSKNVSKTPYLYEINGAHTGSSRGRTDCKTVLNPIQTLAVMEG
jgi:hypothetical protein